MLTRRTMLASSAGLLSAGLVPCARAQVLKKSVQIIVGFPAGGGTDLIARILAERLRGPYSSAVIVENKPGAAARISVEYVKSADPDGSVMLFTPDFPITVYPHSFRALSYDPLRDLIAVAPTTKSALTYNIGPMVPASVKTLADFVAWCKANPDKAIYATTSAGGWRAAGPARRTSAPIKAPMTNSDRPMLNRQSPTNAYDSASYGLPLASCIVRKSANICVGCHSSVSPLYTGTPA